MLRIFCDQYVKYLECEDAESERGSDAAIMSGVAKRSKSIQTVLMAFARHFGLTPMGRQGLNMEVRQENEPDVGHILKLPRRA
jgi:phage terminase small subunit